MPIVSFFFGIYIRFYWREHGVPHFHAKYGDDEIVIAIKDLAILEGGLSPKAVALVMEWALIHKNELIENYELGKKGLPFKKIEPLK